MWTGDGIKHYYVDEIAKLIDGRLVMPLKWVTMKGKVHAECLAITRLPVHLVPRMIPCKSVLVQL